MDALIILGSCAAVAWAITGLAAHLSVKFDRWRKKHAKRLPKLR